MQTPFGDQTLERWPPTSDRSLQAWDAADELLLDHLHENCHGLLAGGAPSILICNDAHGALGCALHALSPLMWSDSSLSHTALRKNWAANKLPGRPVCLDSLDQPQGVFDLILIKIPKTRALLEDQLIRIRHCVHPDSIVIAASLVRHLSRSVFAAFERYLGSVGTSLASKKSRLVFCSLDNSLPEFETPYPDTYTDQDLNLTLWNHANVFCRDRVDMGARLLLQHSRRLPAAEVIIDLACGNGILGIEVQKLQPRAQLHFIDESYMAVASARLNYSKQIQRSADTAIFSVANGLEDYAEASVDLIICNPPFHAQHAVVDDTARTFFRQAAGCLRNGGQLWVVANRHLAYKRYIKRYFSICNVAASSSKFVLLQAYGHKQ